MYGKEMILDIHKADAATFDRRSIRRYCKQLCDYVIHMERETLHFWDYSEDLAGYKAAPAHLRGTSAVQFIRTSNITIHAIEELGKIYVNIFSCAAFDHHKAAGFTAAWFGGEIAQQKVIVRK